MKPALTLYLFVIAMGLAGYLFARNVFVGLRTGAIWARGTRYFRNEQPVSFWITAVIYSTLAAACLVALAFVSWALLTSAR